MSDGQSATCKNYALVSQGGTPVVTSILTEKNAQPPVARISGLLWQEITCTAAELVLTNGLQYRPSNQWRYIFVDGGNIQEIPDNG